MRLRITSQFRLYRLGEVVEAPADVAQFLLAKGIAERVDDVPVLLQPQGGPRRKARAIARSKTP